MKAVIAQALKNMIVEKFGNEKWELVLKTSGLEYEPSMMPVSNIDDDVLMNIINGMCKAVNLTLPEAADAFGEYWMNAYAPMMYRNYFMGKGNAREFLVNMDSVHTSVTRSVTHAHPPHFIYEWEKDNILIMSYKSTRKLIDLFIGLIRGVGKYYNEKLEIFKLDDSRVKIKFPAAA